MVYTELAWSSGNDKVFIDWNSMAAAIKSACKNIACRYIVFRCYAVWCLPHTPRLYLTNHTINLITIQYSVTEFRFSLSVLCLRTIKSHIRMIKNTKSLLIYWSLVLHRHSLCIAIHVPYFPLSPFSDAISIHPLLYLKYYNFSVSTALFISFQLLNFISFGALIRTG